MRSTGLVLLLVFEVALGEALQLHSGRQPPLAYVFLASALLAAALAALVPWERFARKEQGEQLFAALALAGLSLQIWELVTTMPGWPRVDRAFPILRLAILACGIAAAAGIAGRGRVARGAVPLLVLVQLALGLCIVFLTPDPWIDVHKFHAEAVGDLLAGRSPYGQLRRNIYLHYPFYSPEVLTPDRAFVKVGFPYPPLQLLLALPFQKLAGDYRYLHAAALCLSGLLMWRARPGRTAVAAAALFLLTPRVIFFFEGPWTEPLVVLMLSLTLYSAARSPGLLPLALGGLLAIKQYTLPLLLLAPFLLPRAQRTVRGTARVLLPAAALAAAVDLPFFLWNPQGFWSDVLMFQVRQPFRLDSLSFMALAHLHQLRLPAWCSFAALLGLLLAGARFAERSPRGFAAACALAYCAFFATAKQAFPNYYLFPLAAGAWALALCGPQPDATTAHSAQTVNQGA